MKKILITILAIGLIVIIIVGVGLAESTYSRHAEIVAKSENTYTCRDIMRREWQFVSDTDYAVGQNVELRMTTAGTDNIISDDTILAVNNERIEISRYIG